VTVIRVLVADDHSVVRSGFHRLLDAQAGIQVVGEAANGREAVEASRRLLPDVVLMDIRMPVLDGIAATGELAGCGIASRVVILTTYDLDEYVFDALRAGACGFLLKHSSEEEVVAAVRAAAAGDVLLSPPVTRRLVEEFARRRPPRWRDTAELSSLTAREQEVLGLVALGFSNGEIAGRLSVSEGTVKTHVSHVLDKLGLRDRVHAVILAYEMGLVRPAAGQG
jgi:DNA-binding NarL/FixJ family response regulator